MATWLDEQLDAAQAAGGAGAGVSSWSDKYKAHVRSVGEGSVVPFLAFQWEFGRYLVNVDMTSLSGNPTEGVVKHGTELGAKRQARLGISYWGLDDVPVLIGRPEDVPAAANQGKHKGRGQ